MANVDLYRNYTGFVVNMLQTKKETYFKNEYDVQMCITPCIILLDLITKLKNTSITCDAFIN